MLHTETLLMRVVFVAGLRQDLSSTEAVTATGSATTFIHDLLTLCLLHVRIASKRSTRMSALDPPPRDTWQILYWPAVSEDGKITAGAGRAEYLRVIFEAAFVPYEEVSVNIGEYFWSRTEVQPMPVLAPPCVRYNDFVVAQTAVAAKYVAIKCGLFPDGPAEATARAEQIVATVHEYIAEGRMAFHPVKNTMSYHQQVEEAKPYVAAFAQERLPRYMQHFERLLLANDGGEGFFVGSKMSYVDLQVLVMLQVTKSQFPEAWATLETPKLKKFLGRVEEVAGIKEYLASPRKRPFAGDSLM